MSAMMCESVRGAGAHNKNPHREVRIFLFATADWFLNLSQLEQFFVVDLVGQFLESA